jgi:hypothetical protein
LRKFLAAWLAALTLLAALVIPAAAAPKSGDCFDLQSSNATDTEDSRASFDGELSLVRGKFFLAAKPCASVTYTLVLLDNAGDTTPLFTGSVKGSGKDPWVVIEILNVSVADTDVCAYVTTSNNKGELDHAPASGCTILFDDGTSPGGGKGF